MNIVMYGKDTRGNITQSRNITDNATISALQIVARKTAKVTKIVEVKTAKNIATNVTATTFRRRVGRSFRVTVCR